MKTTVAVVERYILVKFIARATVSDYTEYGLEAEDHASHNNDAIEIASARYDYASKTLTQHSRFPQILLIIRTR